MSVLREMIDLCSSTTEGSNLSRSKKAPQLGAEVEAEILRSTRSDGRSNDWKSGFSSGSEEGHKERANYGKKSAEASLDQLRSLARSRPSDFVLGQIAGYEDSLSTTIAPAELASSPSTEVTVYSTEYRSNHGAEPRGRGDWTFVIGKRGTDRSDDPAIYRPAKSHGVTSLPYAKAKEYAVAEAKRRGAIIVWVAS